MKGGLWIAITGFTAVALAAPSLSVRHVRHERRDDGSLWSKRDVVAADFVLPVRIGLTQSNLDLGHDLLMKVSDPDSADYGKFYTVEEVHKLFAPSEERVAAVRAWLQESGIDIDRISHSVNKQWLQFDAETAEVEDLLKTKFHVYEHSRSGKTSIGCDEYNWPLPLSVLDTDGTRYHVQEDIQHHIDYITPGVKMLELRAHPSKKLSRRAIHPKSGPRSYKGSPIISPLPPNTFIDQNNLENCDTQITPACIRAMYKIPKLTGKPQPGNELGIFEESPEASLDSEDMNRFFHYLAPEIPNGTFPTVYEIDGAQVLNDPEFSGDETLLDFQISYPIIYPQQSVLFATDSDYEGVRATALFNTFLDAIDGSYCTYSAFGETGDNNTVDANYPSSGYEEPLQCGVYNITNVVSVSWELAEYVEGTPANYQMRQCNEYMKLGMQGVTTVFSSGDSGVASAWGCTGTSSQPIFNPNFPSNCPYVLSVGATMLIGNATEDVELAANEFPPGGGFSNYFARPSYQAAAVEAFFNSSNAPTFPYYTGSDVGTGFYNRSGRGYPDVSSVGQSVVIYREGGPYVVSGTSCSAPTWAAILTRINEERLKAGKPTVGFVNPILYKNPHAFHDITVGSNEACGSPPVGFSTAVGWDPVTGLGTPNYPALLQVFMKATEG